ncbi:MAG TPA: cob(I)yrinic acid a,c-diamide adenosyltransferase [Gaiellaceae bacterium]|nr:cob(I)yrinic acid a,c-diamide adenosyltransferase [Gaiellaceae bacterium]
MARERDEPVRLTKIYTRGGDAGETSLGDGSRVSKLDARIAAYGNVDELNAAVGVVVAGGCPETIREVLVRVQNELFDLGADLSVPIENAARLRVTQEQVDRLEDECDRFNAELPDLKSFVLPGGTEAAARLHLARTVCRRAEREALVAAGAHDVNTLAIVYLNRLSDLLFILARAANAAEGLAEPLWRPGSSS